MSRIPDLLAAGPTVSLEYFPPVLGPARLGALRAVVRLAGRRPDFVSVTEGAGGSDRGRTRQIVVDVDVDVAVDGVLEALGDGGLERVT